MISSLALSQLEPSVADLVEDLINRVQAGEAVDLDAWIRANSEHTDVLRRLLPAVQVLADLSRSQSAVGSFPPAEADGEPPPGTLGDFRIIREVGRGGMGVVYEAEQISLGRRVALKVLPFAATMDPKHLQRFHNEARAAASLHHTNIVPVFGVGTERGVHFYAMQFIDGVTLGRVIDDIHRPAGATDGTRSTLAIAGLTTDNGRRGAEFYRTAARLTIDAAEALEHAHTLGIVHRDVKPCNLMLDAAGKLWVTDFGLARFGTDPGLTMSGDLLGTLRYMSPEQALAKHGLVDHRTDVHGLGATLYELLTGRPAVAGAAREDILRRIAFEAPVPPRRLDPNIPRDVETVALKCLEKDPGQRYSSARELADDLRCYLELRPIRAKPPSRLRYLRKWGQRHQSLVTMAVGFLVLVTMGLATGAFLIWQAKERTRLALTEAKTSYTKAETQRQRAERDFRRAYWAIENMLGAFDPGRNSQPWSVPSVKQWQLHVTKQFLVPLCEDENAEPPVRLQRGVAYITTGRIDQIVGDEDSAQQSFRQGIAVFQSLALDYPDEPLYLREVGIAKCILAECQLDQGHTSEASFSYKEGVAALRETIGKQPSDLATICQLALIVGCWSDARLRDPAEATRLARRAVELAPNQPKPRMVLGVALYRSGDYDMAVRELQHALRLDGEIGLRNEEPFHPFPVTQAELYLAMAQWRRGNRKEALTTYQVAAQRMDESLNSRYRSNLECRAEARELLGIGGPEAQGESGPSRRHVPRKP